MVLYLHSVSYSHVGPKAAGGAGLTIVTWCRGTEEMVAMQRKVVALIIWTNVCAMLRTLILFCCKTSESSFSPPKQ